jgi:hypothetical protein
MTGEPGADDEITEETRRMVTRIRERAAKYPAAADIASLTETAVTEEGRRMTPEQIRALGRETVSLAERVAYLLGRLSGLLGEEGTP